MDETILEPKNNKKKITFHFEWVLPSFVKPKSTLHTITKQEKSVWLTPLLVLSALIVIAVLISAPIQRNIIQMGMNIPENFQYFSAEQQAQFMSAQANRTSPLFLYVFPILTRVGGLWISWFLLSSLLHLSLTLSGSRAANTRSYNLAGWSFLPIGLRVVVQIVAMLISQSVISAPGLSGFVAADAKGVAAFFGALLGLIDIFFVWQVVLLFLGSIPLSGLAKSKAWTATGISVFILMLLQSIPGFLSQALSGLSMSTPFYF